MGAFDLGPSLYMLVVLCRSLLVCASLSLCPLVFRSGPPLVRGPPGLFPGSGAGGRVGVRGRASWGYGRLLLVVVVVVLHSCSCFAFMVWALEHSLGFATFGAWAALEIFFAVQYAAGPCDWDLGQLARLLWALWQAVLSSLGS